MDRSFDAKKQMATEAHPGPLTKKKPANAGVGQESTSSCIWSGSVCRPPAVSTLRLTGETIRKDASPTNASRKAAGYPLSPVSTGTPP